MGQKQKLRFERCDHDVITSFELQEYGVLRQLLMKLKMPLGLLLFIMLEQMWLTLHDHFQVSELR